MQCDRSGLSLCAAVLMLVAVGCSAPGGKSTPPDVLQLALRLSDDGGTCTVIVFNPTDRPLEYDAAIDDSFEIKALAIDDRLITQTDDSPDGWWGLGRLSSKLTPTPLPMTVLPPHSGATREFNVRGLLEAFGRRYQLEPGEIPPKIASVATRCSIATQREADNWIDARVTWHQPENGGARPLIIYNADTK